jgi:hypothetical protein
MSIEIEVGLENASRVKPTMEELKLEQAPPKGLANPRTRFLLFGGGLVLLVLLIGLFLYYRNRESTDDAQVDGHITQISSKVYGRVGGVLVNDNQQVKAGQVLVKRRLILCARRALTIKRKLPTWPGRRPTSKKARPTRNWGKRIWSATGR